MHIMPHIHQSLCIKSVVCLFVMVITLGCSNSVSEHLLNGGLGPVGGAPIANLAMPPADAFQAAIPEKDANFIEESNLSADVPTLSDMSSRPIEGIDAPKVGLSLDEDISSRKIEETVLWRGKRSVDGMDLANRDGALCSGVSRDISVGHAIRVACSDGRIGTVRLIPNTNRAQIAFKTGPAEAIDLQN